MVLGAIIRNQQNKSAQGQANKNVKYALGELSPQNIQALLKQFYSGDYNQVMPQMQTAMAGMGAQAARHGLTGTGAYQQLAAGMPGQFSQMALGMAGNQALETARSRANVRMGMAPGLPQQDFGPGLSSIGKIIDLYLSSRNKQPDYSGLPAPKGTSYTDIYNQGSGSP